MTSSAPAAQRAANRRGIFAMAAGMASFVSNDALVKHVSESLPAPQLIFLRGLFATALLLVAVHLAGATRRLGAIADRRVLLRSAFDAFATVAYLTSLFDMPIGNATAINMAAPLFIGLMAVVAFGERVGPGRWLAIATGFAGVLLIVRPSSQAFNAYALLCLAGTVLHAGRDLMTRTIDRSIPAIVITFGTALAVTVLTGAWTLASDWQPVSLRQLALLGAASVFLSGGYFLITLALRSGEMSVIAPFRYTDLLFALVLGFVVWGDVPDAIAWGGIALLAGAGIAILHGERRRARAAG